MSVVTIDHLTKHLKKRLRKGDYGSVLITIQDGMVTGVNDLDSFNAAAFVDHVEKPATRYIIRNKEETVLLEKSKKEQDDTIIEQNSDNDSIIVQLDKKETPV